MEPGQETVRAQQKKMDQEAGVRIPGGRPDDLRSKGHGVSYARPYSRPPLFFRLTRRV